MRKLKRRRKRTDDTKEKPEEHDRIKFDKEISEIIKKTQKQNRMVIRLRSM